MHCGLLFTGQNKLNQAQLEECGVLEHWKGTIARYNFTGVDKNLIFRLGRKH